MKLSELPDVAEFMNQFTIGLSKVVGLLFASGGSFFVANNMPDEVIFGKEASLMTGWGLAVACIYTLAKVVKRLFEKIEERDKVILDMHKESVAREKQISDERQEAIDDLERRLNR